MFLAEHSALLEEVVTLNLRRFSPEELEKFGDISTSDLTAIRWLVEVGND